MGMYTGLRGTIKVSDEYKPYFDLVFLDFKSFEEVNLPPKPSTKRFVEDVRNSFIPFGSICYMPDDWVQEVTVKDNNEYYFCCSLKNYNSTIEKFFDFLNEINAEYLLEYLYEESNVSTFYTNSGSYEGNIIRPYLEEENRYHY